jgi:hypothetical protein
MHSVTAKPFYVDSVVIKQVAIEPVIVPYFLVFFALQVLLKVIDKSCILAKIINEHSGTVSKIVLRSGKKRCRNDPTLPNGSFVLDIKINSFSIPGYNRLSFPQFFNTIQTLIAVGNDGGPGNDILMVILLHRIRVLVSLLAYLLELFNGMVFELAGVDLI